MMDFSTFAQILSEVYANGMTDSDFVKDLLLNILREDKKIEEYMDDLDPSTLRKYFSGTRGLSKFARDYVNDIDAKRFVCYLKEKRISEDDKKRLCEDLKSYAYEADVNNVEKKLADMFTNLLHDAKKGRRKPSVSKVAVKKISRVEKATQPDIGFEFSPHLLQHLKAVLPSGIEQLYPAKKKLSPLAQILNAYSEHRFFLLCSEGPEAQPGNGKTAALMKLSQELPQPVKYISLEKATEDSLMADALENDVLLLDDLEKLTYQQLEYFAQALPRLMESGVKLVVASSVSPNHLLGFRALKSSSALWRKAIKCVFQPLSIAQKKAFLGENLSKDAPLSELNTPYLLALYKKHPSKTLPALFYDLLDREEEDSAEYRRFFRLFVLPALAWQTTLRSFLALDWSANEAEVAEKAFKVYRFSLASHRAYRDDPLRRADLADAAVSGDLTAENLLGNSRFLAQEVSEDFSLKFISKDASKIAPLHLAHLFFAAYKGELHYSDSSAKFFYFPSVIVPHEMLRMTAGYIDTLFEEEGFAKRYLSSKPTLPEEPYSHYFLSLMCQAMCNALGLDRSWWVEQAIAAYDPLALGAPYDSEQMELLIAQARGLREAGKLNEAIAKADEATCFCTERGLEKNTCYQAKALIYAEAAARVLNGKNEKFSLCIGEDVLAVAEQIYVSLQTLEEKEFLTLLDTAHQRMLDYAECDAATQQFAKLSFVSKVFHCCAAMLGSGNGAALNSMALFFENNDEDIAHKATAQLCDVPSADYRYGDDHLVKAFTLFEKASQRMIGIQPYSWRKNAMLLLYRRVRLVGGRAVPGKEDTSNLMPEEIAYLATATLNAKTSTLPGACIPRIWFLLDRAGASSAEMADHYLEEAKMLYREEWARCRCDERLTPSSELPVDMHTIELVSLWREGFVPINPAAWTARINAYFRKKSTGYRTGTRVPYDLLRKRLEDLERRKGIYFG